MTTPFDELEPAEAEEIVARFVAERPLALTGLRDRLVVDGHDADAVLDGSVDSLVPVWAWIKGRLRLRNDDAWESEAEPFEGQPVPEWYRHATREERLLSLDSVHLLDGLISYVGEVVMGAVPGVTWRRGHDHVRDYIEQNRPVLAQGPNEVGVSRMVFGSGRRHLFEPGSSPDGALKGFVDRWIDGFGQPDGPEGATDPKPRDPVFAEEIAVERDGQANEWIVEFGDDLRAMVGQQALDRLADVLPGNAGVTAAAFEDREVLVASGPIDPAALKLWIVAELARTATAGS